MTDTKPNAFDHSKGKLAVWVPITLAIATAAGSAGGWLLSQRQASASEIAKLRESNEEIIANYLVATQTSLTESKQAYDHQQQFAYAGTGTLESYIYYAQDHGGVGRVAELAGIKELTELNQDIQFRTKSYLPCALTPEYKAAAARFLRYVGLFIRRAHAVEALAKTKEGVPTYDTFPLEFPAAIETEIKARRAAQLHELPPSTCVLRPTAVTPKAG